jgi:hypothetical protein
MATTLLIYRNTSANEMVLALRIVLNDKGKVKLLPGDGHVEEAMSFLADGASSPTERRQVKPEEGEAYIRAVYSMLSRSSVWRAVPENKPAG